MGVIGIESVSEGFRALLMRSTVVGKKVFLWHEVLFLMDTSSCQRVVSETVCVHSGRGWPKSFLCASGSRRCAGSSHNPIDDSQVENGGEMQHRHTPDCTGNHWYYIISIIYENDIAFKVVIKLPDLVM